MQDSTWTFSTRFPGRTFRAFPSAFPNKSVPLTADFRNERVYFVATCSSSPPMLRFTRANANSPISQPLSTPETQLRRYFNYLLYDANFGLNAEITVFPKQSQGDESLRSQTNEHLNWVLFLRPEKVKSSDLATASDYSLTRATCPTSRRLPSIPLPFRWRKENSRKQDTPITPQPALEQAKSRCTETTGRTAKSSTPKKPRAPRCFQIPQRQPPEDEGFVDWLQRVYMFMFLRARETLVWAKAAKEVVCFVLKKKGADGGSW